jgi:hypothetical protein
MRKKVSLLVGVVLFACYCKSAQAGDKNTADKQIHKISSKAVIGKIKSFTGDVDTTGLKKGDKAPDMILYTTDGMPMKVSELLADKVPILLVGGSYTCPFFRKHVPDVTMLKNFYKDKLKIYIVYTIEAHPDDVTGPLSDTIDLAMENVMFEMSYSQPKTFGQRKAMTDTLTHHMQVDAPILIDGPNNDFWKLYGPAPNVAYLIDTDMIVKGKNAWLNEAPENIWCDIDMLLNMSSGRCR